MSLTYFFLFCLDKRVSEQKRNLLLGIPLCKIGSSFFFYLCCWLSRLLFKNSRNSAGNSRNTPNSYLFFPHHEYWILCRETRATLLGSFQGYKRRFTFSLFNKSWASVGELDDLLPGDSFYFSAGMDVDAGPDGMGCVTREARAL